MEFVGLLSALGVGGSIVSGHLRTRRRVAQVALAPIRTPRVTPVWRRDDGHSHLVDVPTPSGCWFGGKPRAGSTKAWHPAP